MVNLLNLPKLFESLKKDSLIFSLVRIVGDPEISKEMDSYLLECETIPDENPCQISLSVNPGVQTQTTKDEIWIALFDENLNNGFLVQKIVNTMAKLHSEVVEGDHTAIMAKPEKKILLTNDLAAAVAENLVLGQKLKSYLKEMRNYMYSHQHTYATAVGNPFITYSSPIDEAVNTPLKLNLGDTSIDSCLSDFAFIKDKPVI